LFSEYKNTFLSNYTLKVESLDFTSADTCLAYLHFDLSHIIAFTTPQQSGLDLFCSLVPLDSTVDGDQKLVPLSASAKFGTSAISNSLDGFEKTNVWDQYTHNLKSDKLPDATRKLLQNAKAKWEQQLALNHRSDRAVRIAFAPFATLTSDQKLEIRKKVNENEICIIWDGDAVNAILEDYVGLLGEARNAFNTKKK